MNSSSIYYILVHLVLLVRVNVVLSHRNLKSREPQHTTTSANVNNSNNSLSGRETVSGTWHRIPTEESSDHRDIPPRKSPKRLQVTSNQEQRYRFKRMDNTERRYTTPTRISSQPVEERPLPKPTGNTLIVLDMDKTHDVFGYQISRERDKVIYRADPSFLFRQVKRGNDILWSSKNDGHFPYKVVSKQKYGDDDIKVYFPRPPNFEETENVDVVRPQRPAYDMSNDPNFMYTPFTHEESVGIPHEHSQPWVSTHRPEYTHIPMATEPTHFQTQPDFIQYQMTPSYTRFPTVLDQTPTHLDPEFTAVPLTPDPTHSKVSGDTRAFDATEPHGSFTHGSDPRHHGRGPPRPPDQQFVHQMTPEYSQIPMGLDQTPTHLDPEFTAVPLTPDPTHSKVSGDTRAFDATEPHGSFTHGTDPRHHGRGPPRPPDQQFVHQMTPEYSQIPMGLDQTPTHLDPEFTAVPLTPDPTHTKVSGDTRAFDATEPHGSFTHGTVPRHHGRGPPRPPDQQFVHQMTPEYSQIPMGLDQTPTHLDPEFTAVPLTPDPTHTKVSGDTRAFDATEPHGSFTHGTDPRHHGRGPPRPPDQQFVHQMTPEYSQIPMGLDQTPTHLDPEFTAVPLTPDPTHSKVSGDTRAFDATEPHGSFTHGTDPRHHGRGLSRPDQQFVHQMTPEYSQIPMGLDQTPTHLDPEFTAVPLTPDPTHSKVSGDTRAFDATEPHGSFTHGSDPRHHGRGPPRPPDQQFVHQMTPEYSQIPMGLDQTPTHLDPEFTAVPLTPDPTHSKVSGDTRAFDATEPHGSFTHGSDPRHHGRGPPRPPDQQFVHQMTPEYSQIPMGLDQTPTHLDPEFTAVPLTPDPTHTKVSGDTRAFDATEPHGSFTHGSDPRHHGRGPPRPPDQQFGQEFQSRSTHPIERLRERHRMIEETEKYRDHPARRLRHSDRTLMAGSQYPMPPQSHPIPMAQPVSQPSTTPFYSTPSSSAPSQTFYQPTPVPTSTPAAKQVPDHIQEKPGEPSSIQPESTTKEAERHVPDDVGKDRFGSLPEGDLRVTDAPHPDSKIMVDASTSTVNYTDASTQFPEWMSVPVRAIQTSEKATSTFDIPKVEQPSPERITSSVRSRDSTRKEEILLEPTPVDSTLREELIIKPSVPEPPKRPEPTPCEEPIVEEIRTDAHTGEIGSDEFIFIQDIGPDEEADLPTRQMPTRQEPIRQTTVGRETAQETVRQEVISEHAPRVPPESVHRPSEPAPSQLPERDEFVFEERPREPTPREPTPREPQSREPQTSVDTDVNQPESTRESQPRPSTSGEGIRRTTTSGDRINITQSENEIRINTTDPENGSYSIDIDPKKHDKVVLTFANNSTVFVLDGANHTLGLNQGVEPGNIASERLTMQRVSPEPVGGLIGGPTPVDTDTIPVTKDATPDQRDPEGRPTERRPEKFTISPDDLVHPPPPYTTPGFPAPSYLPEQRVIPDDSALRRLTTLLELTTISNLAQLSRPASYTPTTDVRVDHNPHDPPSETTSLRVPDSDGEEITAAAPESTTPAPVDPFSTPSDEGESITGDLEDSSEQQPQPRPRADANGNGSGSGIGRSSSPITIALEEDDNESGSDFTLDLNATDTDENMCETREDSATNESTYTFKSTTRCTEVRIDHITIWKKGDQNFNKPGNVKYNKSSNVITISDGTTGILYKLVNGTWQFDSSVTYSQQTSTPAKSPKVDQKSTVTKNPVQLNIKKKNSTEVYNYVKENKTGTYTAKEGFGFNSVVSSGSLCCQSNINIWDARVKDQYGNKVVVDGLGNKKKTLTIHFDDDDKKITFKKDDKEWMQHESVKKEKVIDPSTDLSVTTGGGQSVTVS